ncbi:Nucleoside 2-deoxyribosyltransferase [Labrenzia sp. THAF82]|uniref:PfkB family carbohydrate kinase n=1 Tax=Labrenzia sp. THAF82 TaxID=2587861 RepID=UPI0012693B43|nr:PfkB family carbohydrate kinase [Labrenzia sp. THAF82]QFT34126.1 Nucleoside 2-deoxyribosyltransferase [Labrenzia sp. THAF82]
MMLVVGGYYREVCVSPARDEQFGSGGRAAFAIASTGTDVEWHYYCPSADQVTAKYGLPSPHLVHFPTTSDALITFTYFHPLSKPEFVPAHPTQHPPIKITGENILRFGFMEGDAVVRGNKVVFDPQNPNEPISFCQNGSSANHLAIVLNAQEVKRLGCDESEALAVKNIQSSESASVILVKSGPQGCRVYIDGQVTATVPPYRTDRVYKIGSGDIFSAAFAYHWAERSLGPAEAADAASRCVARYCDTRKPSVLLDDHTARLDAVIVKNEAAKVYVAGPFFTMGELWLVLEACRSLDELGVRFFSPYHEAGLLGDYEDSEAHLEKISEVVRKDLSGLADCSAVFAVLDGCDPGTLFEIGWAVNQRIPVVAFSQNPKPADLTMIRGSTGCFITNDFASAIYRVAWQAWSQ